MPPVFRSAGPTPPIRRIVGVMLPNITAILASITSVLVSLCTLILIMAGLANSKPAQLTQGKWMMWSIVAVQLIALAVSIWLMTKHKPWPATIVGIIPFVGVIVLIIVLVKIEW